MLIKNTELIIQFNNNVYCVYDFVSRINLDFRK
jgi:hypothetical protein